MASLAIPADLAALRAAAAAIRAQLDAVRKYGAGERVKAHLEQRYVEACMRLKYASELGLVIGRHP